MGIRQLTAVLVLALAIPGAAFAYEVRGKVVSVAPESNKLVVAFTDPYSGAEKSRDVLVKPDTIYTGVPNFAGLQPGQPVFIDVEEDQIHGWVASAVKTNPS